MPAAGDDRALVGVVNFLLVMALVTSALGTVAMVWDPELVRRTESAHASRVQGQVADLAASLDALALGGVVNSTVRWRVDLGSEAHGLITRASTYGSVGLSDASLNGSRLDVSATLTQRIAGQDREATFAQGSPAHARVLAGLDRGNAATLTQFNLRITDVARLVQDGNPETFRVAVLRSGVCLDASCPQLGLGPNSRGSGSDYHNKVIWIGSFARTKANGLDAITIKVWPHDGASTTSWSSVSGASSNVETLNLLCDENSSGIACPSARPRSPLDRALQLWPVLFRNGTGVPGQQYEVWLVNGHRAYGTFAAGGAAGAPATPGTFALPIPTADQTLEVTLNPRFVPARALRLEHGALIAVDGPHAAMLSPPPFAFRRVDNGTVEATLRFLALSGPSGAVASSDALTVGASLVRQVPVDGTAGVLVLRLPTASCAAWQGWFRGAMENAKLTEGAGFTTACANGAAQLTLLGPSASASTQDLQVHVLWSGFRVEVRG